MTGNMLDEIETALRDAFREESQLKIMLLHKLDINLNEIASGENYKELVFNVVQYFDKEGRLPELIEKSCQESNNLKLKELNHKIKNLSPSISDNSLNNLYKPTISKKVQQLDETDIKNLEDFIKRSGKATSYNSRIALCNKIGVPSDDVDFLEKDSVNNFANLLVKYLINRDDWNGILRLCKELQTILKGRILTQLDSLEVKVKSIKNNLE